MTGLLNSHRDFCRRSFANRAESDVWFARGAVLCGLNRVKEGVQDFAKAEILGHPKARSAMVQFMRTLDDKSVAEFAEAPPSSTRKACFLATAAFGSALAPEVQFLRFYRDQVLSSNRIGKHIVDTYNHMSPPIANLIATSVLARSITLRFIVRPALRLARAHVRVSRIKASNKP